jgi:uncharacterized protein YcbK (DUF882 family)
MGSGAKRALTNPDNTAGRHGGGRWGVAATVGRYISRNSAVLSGRAQALNLVAAVARAGAGLGLVAWLLVGAVNSPQSARAAGDARTLSFHHVHTGEDLTVTFYRDGHYVPSALKKLDWFMRDWRKNEEVHMDPHLFDLLWLVYREVGATQPIQIICGYRSPGTNALLHARSGGVARFSQHILGKAIDFYIPDVPLAKIRAVGLQMQRGGVGFYPTSGSPFVHMDVGTVRHWPNIPREALVKLFPEGRTVHIPADGKPLPGYAEALAEIERHGNVPNARSLEAAREAGLITAKEEHVAELVGEAREQPLIAEVETGKGTGYTKPGEAPLRLASLTAPKPVATKTIVPLPIARPQPVVVAAAQPPAAAHPLTTASLAGDAAASRNIWGDVIKDNPHWADADTMPSFDVAANDPTFGGNRAFAYAAESSPAERSATHVRPMGNAIPRLAREATVIPADDNTTIAVKPPLRIGGLRADSPWLRAAMLTPSMRRDMTATKMGADHRGWLATLLDKPAQAVLMTFSADPHLGMVADRFTGHAVVFLATATFTRQTTASLQ